MSAKSEEAKILIVEDEDVNIDILEKILNENNMIYDIAKNGEECMQHMVGSNIDEKYDVILLDLMLPDKNGNQLLKEIRFLGVDTPVIIMTANSKHDSKMEGFENEADDYVVKPFDPDELMARILVQIRHNKQRRCLRIKYTK